MALVVEGGIQIGGGISITPVSEITYTAGLFKTTYNGYFNDNVSFFATATPAAKGANPANATVNNGGLHATRERSGTAALTAGVYYPIRIQFGENTGGDVLTFNFSTPTITKTTNVTNRVFYNSDTNGF